jgi:hypothetical protein
VLAHGALSARRDHPVTATAALVRFIYAISRFDELACRGSRHASR